MLTTLNRIVKQVVERRSSQWPKLRREWLAEHPTCAACGTTKKNEVHHCVPVSHDPTRELDATNLITLCEHRECHHRIGHAFDWRAANPHCREDAAMQLQRIAERVRPK